ncbi:hypothetical protein VTL71DRAFT_1120, partial [Oculimacula yallundae]
MEYNPNLNCNSNWEESQSCPRITIATFILQPSPSSPTVTQAQANIQPFHIRLFQPSSSNFQFQIHTLTITSKVTQLVKQIIRQDYC